MLKESVARAANKVYRMFFDLKRSIAAQYHNVPLFEHIVKTLFKHSLSPYSRCRGIRKSANVSCKVPKRPSACTAFSSFVYSGSYIDRFNGDSISMFKVTRGCLEAPTESTSPNSCCKRLRGDPFASLQPWFYTRRCQHAFGFLAAPFCEQWRHF